MQVNYFRPSDRCGEFTDESVLTPVTVVIPYWLDKVLINNKLEYKDIYTNYDKVRKCFALDDIIDLYSCYGIVATTSNKETDNYLNQLLADWHYALSKEPFIKSEDLLKEYQATVNPLLNSASVIERLRDRLISKDTTILNIDYSQTFSILKLSDRSIIIKMNVGFVDTLTSLEGRKLFLVKYLEALYSFSHIQDVSKHPAFTEYVKVLQSL